MSHQDLIYMKRALQLASKGAGLVSPNPLVGAVLVKNGRVVGEGYHRYDRLKHAETYAIEISGSEARGATLYCSLEPCSHQGRTPPCTGALIEAGIERAVISIKDPNPLVNGKGISELRAAGVEVDVGLCHAEALRLNECYFRYIASNRPFVHGIIEYEDQNSGEGWEPSNSFLKISSDYDAVLLGSRHKLNLSLASARLTRERHRPLVVAGARESLESLRGLFSQYGEQDLVEVVVPLGPTFTARIIEGELSSKLPDPASVESIFSVSTDLDSVLETLGRLEVTSVVATPGVFDPGFRRHFEQLDRLTLAVPAQDYEGIRMSTMTFEELEFDLDEVTVSEAHGYTEFTGYPSLRGVA